MADKKIDIDELVRHELYLHRLAQGGLNSIITPSIEETFKAVKAILDAKGMPRTPNQLAKLEEDIAKAIRSGIAWVAYNDSLNDAAIYEAGIANLIVSEIAVTAAISNKAVIDYAKTAFMDWTSGAKSSAGTWDQFIAASNNSTINQMVDIVRTGYSRGQTIQEVVKNVRTMFEGATKRDIETLALTGFSHFTNSARNAWANANADLDLMAHLVFTFDNRISSTCKSISTGKTVFALDDPKRRTPPFHPRCRTFEVFLPKGAEISGTRASVGGKSGDEAKEAFEKREANLQKRRDNPNIKGETSSQVRYRGKRDTNIFDPKQVKAGTTYESWLKNQPAWFIDDSLGIAKGKLFRAGGKLESFYDMTNKPLTLQQLRNREPKLWARAFD